MARVLKCHGGSAVMHILMQERPDALVLDVMMLELSGLEVLRFICRESGLEKITVIIVSTKCLLSDLIKGLDAEASIYLPKPVEYNKMKKALEFSIGLPA